MLRISCDDACASDVRLADLCKKYEIECVFYWPVEWHSYAHSKGYDPLTYHEAYDISKDFEIGSHTITHRLLTELREIDAMVEIMESKLMLESLFNRGVSKFCPPRGYTNPILSDLTLKQYYSQRLTKGKGLVHIHPDSGANNNIPWREYAKAGVEELWCHSWELDRFDLWQELEDYFANLYS